MTDTLRPVQPSAASAASAAEAPDLPAPDGPRKLKRSIGVVGGTLLTISCVTPASTLFVVVPDLFSTLGTATAPTIAVGSLLCIAVAFCYSELGTLIPSAGGEYAMVSTLAGRLAGWLVFVLSLLVVMIVPPVIAMGTADYLAPVVHLNPSMAGAGVIQQDTSHLLWTGGITAAATLYWAFYLRPRRESRWLVTVPEDTQA